MFAKNLILTTLSLLADLFELIFSFPRDAYIFIVYKSLHPRSFNSHSLHLESYTSAGNIFNKTTPAKLLRVLIRTLRRALKLS